MNNTLHNLTQVKLNILDFKVSNCEICFNLKCNNQKEVESYITIFNKIFIRKKDKRYTDFTIEEKKPLHSSYYVKPKKQYRDNNGNSHNKSYTVNFYNKLEQLQNRIKEREKEHKKTYSDEID